MQNLKLAAGTAIVWLAVQATAAADDPAIPPSSSVDAAFAAHFAAMIDAGFDSDANRLDEARRHYQSARRHRPEDPRVEYGFAVVLLKNFQQQEALDHLQASIDAEPAYLPAWRLRFRETVRARDVETLFDQLLALADVVGVISDNPPEDVRRVEIAEWLGSAVAYLEGPLGNHEVAEKAGRVAEWLRARLGESLLSGFEAGRVATIRRHQLLQSHQLAAVQLAATEREEELQQTQTARENLGEEREQLAMTREEWDAWIEEQVGDIDAQLDALHEQYGQVREQQGDVNSAAVQVRGEIMQITALAQQSAAGQTVIRADPFILEGQLISRQAELDRYSAEYNALETERLQLLAGAEGLFAEREASIRRYQKATGNAADRIQQIDRWDRRLEQEAETSERSNLENTRQVRNVRHRIQNWSTYDPFDLNAEPDRLLAELQLIAP